MGKSGVRCSASGATSKGEWMTDEERLAELLEQKRLIETEVRERQARHREINKELQGDNNTTGLAARVAAAHRLQKWHDAAPERAAIRATPEWQEWRRQFMASRSIVRDHHDPLLRR